MNRRMHMNPEQKSCESFVTGMLENNYFHVTSDPGKIFACETLLKRDNDKFKETLKNSTTKQLLLDIKNLGKWQNEVTESIYGGMVPSCVKFIDEKIKEIEFFLQEQERHEMEQEDYRSETSPKVQKVKKEKIPSTIKKLVWNIHIGEDVGKSKCTCCKSTDITQMSFHCGHVIAESKGGKTIVSNLAPICQNCNSSMGTKNMKEFMDTLK